MPDRSTNRGFFKRSLEKTRLFIIFKGPLYYILTDIRAKNLGLQVSLLKGIIELFQSQLSENPNFFLFPQIEINSKINYFFKT